MKGYDFEVLVDEINANKERARERDKNNLVIEKQKIKVYKLKKWVKVVLWTLLVAILSIAIYQLKTYKSITQTPVGTYTCHGKLIKVCSGSKEVADYLGV